METHIYKPQSYPFDLIAPITILWRPCKETSKAADIPTPKRSKAGKKGENNTATKEIPASEPIEQTRTVWVFVHPATHDEVFSALQSSASSTLERLKRVRDDSYQHSVEIAHLHRDVNVFEIMGPKASQVIKGALTPASNADIPEPEVRQVGITDFAYDMTLKLTYASFGIH